MTLISNRYGKGRVRILRVHRDGERHEVRELSVQPMLTGDFSRVFTHADNATALCTDTMKNLVNIVARENLDLDSEAFCRVLAQRFLQAYHQVEVAEVTAHETRWHRYPLDGHAHPHTFTLDGNGQNVVEVRATRDRVDTVSGVEGFTFMKTTESGWDKYYKDQYTTLVETRDRICATAMEARWAWGAEPADFRLANAKILKTMLDVFATTYSESVQDSLYRMGLAALDAVPEIDTVSLACPNKHYIPINLQPFGMDNQNMVFLPTDEPHGQIECTVGRKA